MIKQHYMEGPMILDCIILAAGVGKRMKSKQSKQFIEVENKPIIYYTIKQFLTHPKVNSIILVAHKDEIEEMIVKVLKLYFEMEFLNGEIRIVEGGAERYNSVYNGLSAIDDKVSHVMIHDGARPLISHDKITELIECLHQEAAAILAVRQTNTMKTVDSYGYIVDTIPREKLVVVQTPQAFKKTVIVDAYKKGLLDPVGITDDAMMVEQFSETKVKVIIGEYSNIKVTTPEDLVTLKSFLKKLH